MRLLGSCCEGPLDGFEQGLERPRNLMWVHMRLMSNPRSSAAVGDEGGVGLEIGAATQRTRPDRRNHRPTAHPRRQKQYVFRREHATSLATPTWTRRKRCWNTLRHSYRSPAPGRRCNPRRYYEPWPWSLALKKLLWRFFGSPRLRIFSFVLVITTPFRELYEGIAQCILHNLACSLSHGVEW